MWQILKAEFQYYKNIVQIAYGVVLLFFVVALLWLQTDTGALISFSTLAFAFSCIVMGAMHENEKRMRFHAALPVRPRDLGMVDALFCGFFFLGMCLLWLAHALLRTGRFEAPTLSNVIFGFANMQSAVAVFIISAHLRHVGRRNHQWIVFAVFFMIGAALTALYHAGHFWNVMHAFGRFFNSFAGALVAVVIWLALSATGVVLFAKRKSFLA